MSHQGTWTDSELSLVAAYQFSPECSDLGYAFTRRGRFIGCVRAIVETVAGGVCRNASGSILAPEHVFIVTSSVAELEAQLVGHVHALRKSVTEPIICYANQRVLALGHSRFIFAFIASDWVFIIPVVTIGDATAPITCIHTPEACL